MCRHTLAVAIQVRALACACVCLCVCAHVCACIPVRAYGCLHCLSVYMCPVCVWVVVAGVAGALTEWEGGRDGKGRQKTSVLCSTTHQTLFWPILNNPGASK